MTNAKHTPGPWEIFPTDNLKVVTRSGRGTDVIEIAQCYHYNGEANARLIAAAPELLQALKVALAQVNSALDVTFTNEGYTTAKVIRAAIAEAEGK